MPAPPAAGATTRNAFAMPSDPGAHGGSTRVTRAVVELACLERNWRALRETHSSGRIMTVLKANAYGHGMVPAARFLQGLGQDLFAVALLDEALTLRHAGIRGRLLVLGPPEPGTLPQYGRHRIEATLPSLHWLREAAAAAAQGPLDVHVKCDTGMGRVGIRPEELDAAAAILRDAETLSVRGVFSHLADAERLASDFCETQRTVFERACAVLAEARRDTGAPFERHLANSAGLMRDPRLHYDFARVGFALWAPLGFDPPAQAPAVNARLAQALTLRTRVSHVKRLQAGDTVGYSRNYTARAGEMVATLPIGHGDGYFRRLGNAGSVLLGGRLRPIVGNVSMDQTTVSLGDDPCAVGDEAILLGGDPARDGGTISIAELAGWAGTIDYEAFTHLAARVPRDYVFEGAPLPEP